MERMLRDGSVAVLTAAIVFAGAVGLMHTPTLTAAGDADQALPLPTITVDGCELALLAPAPPGETENKAVARIRVVNPNDRVVRINGMLMMHTMGVESRMSRMPAMPQKVYEDMCPIAMLPHETRIIDVATGVELAPGNSAHFTLVIGDQTLTSTPVALPIQLQAEAQPLTQVQ